MMKIVLKQDVDNLGISGQIVEVAGGYARNFLLPKGLALEATPSNLKVIEAQKKRIEARRSKERSEMEALAQRITATPLELAHRAGDTDTIYGAVTAAEIAFALEERGIEIDHRRVLMDAPIKALGTYTIPIKLHADVTAHVSVSVVREEV
jgi:large subunit ribosomal protein L9